MDWTQASLREQARAIREGEIQAEALVKQHLARVARLDGRLGSFLALNPAALEEARAVDKRRARGERLGRLAGVPVGIKDQIVTAGIETTAASKMLQGWVPPYDATVVRRLKAEGAIVLGKNNQDEFGMGNSNERSAFYPCRNPWDLRRVAGGSSGGSAAAVSAGLVSAGLGTDTGGSIRQPAGFCGVVGLKPTYGRVSRHGAIALASSLDQIGPITRDVADAALLLELISGRCALDGQSLDLPPVRAPDLGVEGAGALRGLRLGVPEGVASPNAEVAAVLADFYAQIEALGVRLVPVSMPHLSAAVATYYVLSTVEASSNLARYDGVHFGRRAAQVECLDALYAESRAEGFGVEVKRRIILGHYLLSQTHFEGLYQQAQRVRGLIRADFEAAWAQCDLVVGPTAPNLAPPLGELAEDPIAAYRTDLYTVPASLAGLPALSLPLGTGEGGLPVGLQLVGPSLGEAQLLTWGQRLERLIGWEARPEISDEDLGGGGAAEAGAGRGLSGQGGA